jgi:hypothetical protein
VIESVDQAQSLIKKLLRLRVAGGYGMMQVSQPRHESGRLGRSVSRMILSGDHATQQEHEQN